MRKKLLRLDAAKTLSQSAAQAIQQKNCGDNRKEEFIDSQNIRIDRVVKRDSIGKDIPMGVIQRAAISGFRVERGSILSELGECGLGDNQCFGNGTALGQ